MSASLRVVLMIVLGCGLFLQAHSTQARSDVEAARLKFQEAQKLFENHQYAEAAVLFREAHNLSPNWRLLYNIAQSETAATQYGMALETFERYLASGGDEIPKDRQDEVRSEVLRLRDMVGTLNVKTHRGADILVNGVLRGTAPIHGGIPMAAGQTHRVEIRHEGLTLPEENVRVMGGQTVELTILFDAVDPNDDKEETADELSETVPVATAGRRLQIAGGVLTGIGAAGLLTGGISGALAMSREKTLDRNCDATVCATQYEGIEDTRDRLAVTSTVMFGVGVAAVTAGVVLMVVGKRQKSEQLAVVPMISRDVAGAGLHWTF